MRKPSEETTGWTQVLACNICGKNTKETPNDFIAQAVADREREIVEALEGMKDWIWQYDKDFLKKAEKNSLINEAINLITNHL